MTRVKRGTCARQRRKKLLNLNRSFSGVHSRLFRQAKQQRFKALRSSFVNRKKYARDSRSLWIQRIQSAVRSSSTELKYSTFIHLMKKQQIFLNRKVLAQMIILDPSSFSKLIQTLEKT